MALKTIPEPPAWSLSEELAADASTSRVSEARFSQPLCTAIQIGLVDLLHTCGIRFSAVVGHSSGEIGAAYAAGLLTRRDAISISYYRGHVAHLAQGDAGKLGGMMAARMSFDAAVALCSEQRFRNRVSAAASNSPSSVTLSGDKDAMMELKKHLDGSNIQARALQVDTAYHSHHMLSCAHAYLSYLKQLKIHIQVPGGDHECRWYSSVRRNANMVDKPLESGLDAQYWLDNMVQPVLFSEAVKLAVQDGSAKFNAAVEVGPHPALSGPVNQTLKDSIDYSLDYSGCLKRGMNGIETLSEVLTTIWNYAPSSIDFAGWRTAFDLVEKPQTLKNLPPYAWDHTQIHWRESRLVKNYRLGTEPRNDILGRLWNDAQYEHTWRNIFKLNEMPWVKGHVFQDQVLFPATGYISLALDAVKAFVKGRPIKLVEVRDMDIPTALVIGEEDEVEVLFTIHSRVSPETVEDGSVLEADFACYSYPDKGDAERTCLGRLLVHLGDSKPGDLAPIHISKVELTPFNVDRFYRAASQIGFRYDGIFRALTSLNKSWGHAKALASWTKEDLDLNCSIHPAILDIGLQAGLSTFTSTAEKSMHSPFLPVGIKSAIIDPNRFSRHPQKSIDVDIEAYLTSPSVGNVMEIDINMCTQASARENVCGVQLEGVRFKAISEPQPLQDRNILAKTVWGLDAAYGLNHAGAGEVSLESSLYMPEEYERVALFYLQRLANSVNTRELHSLTSHQQKLIRYVNKIVANVRETDHPFLQKEWLIDSPATINPLLCRHPNDIDMAMLASGGERALSSMRGDSELGSGLLEDLSGNFYQNSTMFAACSRHIASLLRQISHKFPRTDILELSLGASRTTSTALNAIGDAYKTYTCAGASTAVIEELKGKLAPAEAAKVGFKLLDVETQLSSQEIGIGLYDVVIATDVLRASQDLPETVQSLRKLLRTGGFLVCTELTGASLRPTAMMGGLEKWWIGAGNNGTEDPSTTTGQWDKLLHQNGFSGIDCILHDHPIKEVHGFSVFSSQARDDRLDTLQDPLMSMGMIIPTPVVIIGGDTSHVSRLVRRAEKTLRGWASDIQVYSRFDQVDGHRIPPGSSILCLQDLDKPLFTSPPSAKELQNLKDVLESCQNILWVTSARLAGNPYANIMIGIGRALRLELSNLHLHFLDFDEGETWDIGTVMAQFLRLIFSSSSPSATEGMIWLEEQETVIKDSQMLVARIVPDDAANEVYNAKRRRVVKLIDPTEPVAIGQDESSSEPALISSRNLDLPGTHLPIQVELSVALHTDSVSPRYLCYGSLNGGNEEAKLVLSSSEASIVPIHKDFERSSSFGSGCTAAALVDLATFLIASHMVSRFPIHGTTLVCGPSNKLAEVISALAGGRGCKVLFIAITKETQSERTGWISIHPKTPARIAQKLIPSDSTILYSLFKNDVDILLPYLPLSCTARTFDAGAISQQAVEKALETYQAYGEAFGSAAKPTVIDIQDVSQKRAHGLEHLSVVTSWERKSPVKAIVRGLQPSTLLSPDKTYLLVGMASELGQSLTYFMVRGGARHIVLSSRNPKDNQNWIHDLQATGIDIRMVKMDVTQRSQVHEVVSMLRRTMPEIGGVANAALVLEPGVFASLSAASIAKQLKPKVHGTDHLDDEFKSDNLDFFLTFGSLLTVCGNAGQAIYHAGNAFMMSLVNNRRRRGLAASVLNFGVLVDSGFVARADRDTGSNVEDWLRSDIPTALSEADFHHVILQGIVAGHPTSPSGEVIMGLEIYHDQGQTPKPRWVNMASLSHMVRVSEASEDEQTDNAPSSIQQSQMDLQNARTVDEAVPPITELLSNKIEAMMHISLHSIQPDEPLSHLGIDSLNAVEIRSWLREAFQVQIPMNKILGRNPSSSLIQTIAEQYLAKKPTQRRTPDEKPHAAQRTQPAQRQVDNRPTQNTPGATVDSKEKTDKPSLARINRHEREREPSSSSSESSPGASKITTPDGSEPEQQFTRSENLSYAQAGFYYLNEFSDSQSSFNLIVRHRIDGPLNVERFIGAFDKATCHHDALQTCFLATSSSSEIMQHVNKIKRSRLTCLQSTRETANVDTQKALDSIRKYEFSLATGDTFQGILISHDAQWHTLFLAFHNIAIDTTTISYAIGDIDRAYKYQPLPPNPSSMLDFTRQQINDVKAGLFDEGIEYWKGLLDPIPDPLPLLPVAKVKTRQTSRAYGHHLVERELGADFVQRATDVSQSHGVTLMQFYLAAMQVLLCRLLNVDDMCIGIVYNGRDPTSKFARTLGHLANILPVRFNGALSKSFPELLENTSQAVLDCLDYANVPFAVILEKIRTQRSEGNMPLVQVAFDYRAGEGVVHSVGDCTMVAEASYYTTLYDMAIEVMLSPSGGHVLAVRCSDDFYSLSGTQVIAETFVGVLDSLVQAPEAAVKDYRLFSNNQLETALAMAHGPTLEHSWPDTLAERFDQIAARFPDSIAVKDGNEEITYSQLGQVIGKYASVLVNEKATIGSRIAVFCKPSIDLYATMLAVFHIGAVFIPFDVSVPAARRNNMIRACEPDALVFHAATAASVTGDHSGSKIRLLNITKLAQAHGPNTPVPERPLLDPESDSYILFTSGSTGVPKGIKLHQKGVMSYAAHSSKANGFGQMKVLQQTSIGFDLSFAQIYSAFTNGGTLVVASVEARGDPDMLSSIIFEEKVEYTFCTPSEYSLLLTYAQETLQQCHSWRFAGTAGEALPERLVDAMRALNLPKLTLSDEYGPAETYIVTAQTIPVHTGADHGHNKNKVGSIGRVLPNASVYITSERDGSLLPPGMPGEMCIGGISVSNGYLDPKLDEAKFVKDPFTAVEHGEQQKVSKMYKSGDRGVFNEDGSIIFLGRTQGNTVVKLRGQRIDLNEVSGAVLQAAPDHIANAAVTIRGDPQFLVCHVVFKPGKELGQKQLVDLLQSLSLPQYMIPSTIVPLDSLPVTPNGKLDVTALENLPLPTIPANTTPNEAEIEQLTETEARLRAIWLDVIGVVASTVNIGPSSSFFTVGGNSLLLVYVQHAVSSKMGVKIPLPQLRQASDLRAMATMAERGQQMGTASHNK